MRAPEGIAVKFTGTGQEWSARVIAIGSAVSTEAAAVQAALELKPGTGVVATYAAAGFSDTGTRAHQVEIAAERMKEKAADHANVALLIAATQAEAEAKAAALARTESSAAASLAKAKAAAAQATAAAEKASKAASPAKAAKKTTKKAARKKT